MGEEINSTVEYLLSNNIYYVYACCFQDKPESKYLIKNVSLNLSNKLVFIQNQWIKTLKQNIFYNR